MKIFYLINCRIPTEKAEGLEAFKLCEALSEKSDLIFVMPRRLNNISIDPFDFYHTKKNFKIVRLPVIDLIPLSWGNFGFWLEALTFAIFSSLYLWWRSRPQDIIYSHDQISLFLPSFFRNQCYYDIHDFPEGKIGFYQALFANLAGVTTTNNWKKQRLSEILHFPANRIMSWPNGVDLDSFNISLTKTESRIKLSLPSDEYLIGYVGMLTTMGMAKGVDIAIKSLLYLPKDTILVLVGGRSEDIEHYKKFVDQLDLNDRVIFIGWVQHKLIPQYLKALDVLIAPFPKNEHYNHYMSPMKILEYMASQRPIVATNLKSIKEILSESHSILVEPDSESALAGGIKKILDDPVKGEQLAALAYQDVQKYTWFARARQVIELMNNTN